MEKDCTRICRGEKQKVVVVEECLTQVRGNACMQTQLPSPLFLCAVESLDDGSIQGRGGESTAS